MLTEEARFHPVTPYGTSKVLVESALVKMASRDFSPTFLRASTAYGLAPRLRFDLVTNNLTAWAFTTGRVYLIPGDAIGSVCDLESCPAPGRGLPTGWAGTVRPGGGLYL